MRTPNTFRPRLLILLVIVFLAQACQTATRAVETTATGAVEIADQFRESATPVYLEEVIPPCTPIDRSTVDPCEVNEPTNVRAVSSSSSSRGLPDPLFTITDLLLGRWGTDSPMHPSLLPHIVVRGTVQPDTTRCEDYPMKPQNYVSQFSRGPNPCFIFTVSPRSE